MRMDNGSLFVQNQKSCWPSTKNPFSFTSWTDYWNLNIVRNSNFAKVGEGYDARVYIASNWQGGIVYMHVGALIPDEYLCDMVTCLVCLGLCVCAVLCVLCFLCHVLCCAVSFIHHCFRHFELDFPPSLPVFWLPPQLRFWWLSSLVCVGG